MHQTIIEPSKRKVSLNLGELYRYRELLWTLTHRDYRVKYAQTFLGFAWAIINPLLTLVILSFVFGTVANVDTGSVPHLLYTNAGLCGWAYFQAVISTAGTSIIGAQAMVKKVYFPRLIIPISKALTALIDLGIVFGIMAALMIYYRFSPPASIIYLPFFTLIALVSGLAGGIWISALTIRYRDFQHIVPLILRVGMYATPIAFPASMVPEKFLILYYLNPMAGVVEGVRWSIVGGTPPHPYTYISFGLIVVMLILGMFYFKKIERVMADIL
ncbi:MAG: ABC transporter permease [Bacteroidota bacterium]